MTDERLTQLILEATDRIDNDGRDTRATILWLLSHIVPDEAD